MFLLYTKKHKIYRGFHSFTTATPFLFSPFCVAFISFAFTATFSLNSFLNSLFLSVLCFLKSFTYYLRSFLSSEVSSRFLALKTSVISGSCVLSSSTYTSSSAIRSMLTFFDLLVFLFSSLIIFKFKWTVLVLKSFVAMVSSSSISFFGSGSSPPNSSSLVESSSFNIYYNAISFLISSFSFFLRQWRLYLPFEQLIFLPCTILMLVFLLLIFFFSYLDVHYPLYPRFPQWVYFSDICCFLFVSEFILLFFTSHLCVHSKSYQSYL